MFEGFLRIFFDLRTVGVIAALVIFFFVRYVVRLHISERSSRSARGVRVVPGMKASAVRAMTGTQTAQVVEEPESYSWADIVSRSDDGPDTEEFEMRWDDHGEARREAPVRATGSGTGDDTLPAGDVRRWEGWAEGIGRTMDQLDRIDQSVSAGGLGPATTDPNRDITDFVTRSGLDDILPTDRAFGSPRIPSARGRSGAIGADQP